MRVCGAIPSPWADRRAWAAALARADPNEPVLPADAQAPAEQAWRWASTSARAVDCCRGLLLWITAVDFRRGCLLFAMPMRTGTHTRARTHARARARAFIYICCAKPWCSPAAGARGASAQEGRAARPEGGGWQAPLGTRRPCRQAIARWGRAGTCCGRVADALGTCVRGDGVIRAGIRGR